ncbi:MAG: Type 1 glutamine amidotransferase-like domain-containing protein [Thermoplasmata archaeon]
MRTQSSLFRELVSNGNVNSILIIPWTTDSLEKEYSYREIYLSYFRDMGFQHVDFIERNDSEIEIEQKFSISDVLYLPGGDPITLKKEIESKSLQRRISGFGGIVIGNSAGAIVLANCGYASGELYKGFGIIDLNIEVHSSPRKFNINGDCEATIIGIPEDEWIIIRTAK